MARSVVEGAYHSMEEEWTRSLEAQDPDHPVPTAAVHRARALLAQLEADAETRVLHGDLHYHNVLVTRRGPRLINPKGVRGDPA